MTHVANSKQAPKRARMRAILAGALVALLLGTLASPALAGAASGSSSDPTSAQYGPPVTPPQATDPSGLGGNVGPLPFTGFDVIVMAAVALTVTGLGLVLQRAVSRQPTE